MKKSKKLLSVLLAFVMLLSAMGATMLASAADTYKPTYSEDVTEQDIADLIGDINTILSEKALNGATIESIYKALPSLSTFVNGSDKASFYKNGYSELFENLPDGAIVADEYDENNVMTAEGTFTTFFKANPIKVTSNADFQKELNKIIDMVCSDNLANIVGFALFMSDYSMGLMQRFMGNFDVICEALDVEQEQKAVTTIGYPELDFTGKGVQLAKYIKNIVAAVLPDAANNAIGIVQKVTVDEKSALLYKGIVGIFADLNTVLNALKPQLGGLIDLSTVTAKVTELKTQVEAMPTTGEGDLLRFDIEGCISYLAESLTDGALTIKFVDRAENVPESLAALVAVKFRHMKLDRVRNAESTADVVKTIYNYLYDNLIADKANNGLIKTALEWGIIENALGITIPAETKDFVYRALKMTNDELMGEAIVAAANAAGRELPEDPTEPPTEAPTEKPTEKPTEAPAETPTEPTTEAPTTSTQIKDVNIPKTAGKTTAVAGLAVLAIASAAGLVVVAKKKES